MCYYNFVKNYTEDKVVEVFIWIEAKKGRDVGKKGRWDILILKLLHVMISFKFSCTRVAKRELSQSSLLISQLFLSKDIIVVLTASFCFLEIYDKSKFQVYILLCTPFLFLSLFFYSWIFILNHVIIRILRRTSSLTGLTWSQLTLSCSWHEDIN